MQQAIKRFYPKNGKISFDIFELSNTQKDIYNVIKENPGISQKNILNHLNISQQKLNYHIKLMTEARVIKIEKEGKISKCFVIKDIY